jgi:DNA mismatch repair ATPase MutS
MMQAGMFVAAESFTGSVSTGIFTHFKNAAPTETGACCTRG